MDNLEKKRIANEKRLKAIKEWQKNRHNIAKTSTEILDIKVNTIQNKKTVYNSDEETTDSNNKLKLFDSEDENEDLSDCFKIRPQFEGRNGQRMLEMSSELSDRFKLDERFKEDEEESINDEIIEDSEKDKNIRILESILGHEVSKKHPIAQNAKRKREIERFDPDDENNASYIKENENVSKKPKAKKRKSEPEVPIPEEIPISTERYIEVTTDLKDIMSSAGSFSFSEKFNTMVDSKEDKNNEDNTMFNNNFNKGKNFDKEGSSFQKDSTFPGIALNRDANKITTNNFGFSSGFKDLFFISKSDERLKEGVEFFMRPKPQDQIREEWAKKRERILDIFRRRRKSAIRGFAKQPKKQNQRKKFSSKK